MGNSIKYKIIKNEDINIKKICTICNKKIEGNCISCLKCRNLLHHNCYFLLNKINKLYCNNCNTEKYMITSCLKYEIDIDKCKINYIIY